MTAETGDSNPDMASLEAGGADLRQEENLRRENEESKGAKQRIVLNINYQQRIILVPTVITVQLQLEIEMVNLKIIQEKERM